MSKSANNAVVTVPVAEIVRTAMMGFKLKQAVFIHGAPGIGKSDIVRQIGAAMNRPVYDIRLALMNPVDLRGIPMVVDGQTQWLPPCFFKTAENAILFFDEFPAAPPAVQAAAYQIVLDRQIGEFKLPDSCDIIAAGNRTEDKGINHQMAPALRNRFVHLNVEPDLDTWKNWALSNNIHSDIVGYLNFTPGDLFKFDRSTTAGNFPTPRSWARLSDALHMMQSDPAFSGMDTNQAIISGYLGAGTAISFLAFRKIAKTIPNARAIVEKGDMSVRVDSEKPDLLFAFCAALVNLAINNNSEKDANGKTCKPGMQAASNLIEYLSKGSLKGEYVTLIARDFFRSKRGNELVVEFAKNGSSWKKVAPMIGDLLS